MAAESLLIQSRPYEQDDLHRKRKRSLGTVPGPHEAMNVEAVTLNSKLDIARHSAKSHLRGEDHMQIVYHYFMKALICSVSEGLMVTGGWVSLGVGKLVSFYPSPLPDGPPDIFTTAQHRGEPIIYLRAGWLPDGTVLINPYFPEGPPLTSIQHPPSTFDAVIAPLGWIAEVQVSQSESSSSYGSDDDDSSREDDGQGEPEAQRYLSTNWRKMCINLLKQYGIFLSDKLRWATVYIQQIANESSVSSFAIEWPAQLCYRTLDNSHPITDFWSGLKSIKELSDPLEMAEQWFLDTRAGIKTREEEDEVQDKTQINPEEKIEQSEDEEIPPGLITNPKAFGELQSTAGVYPTPPDGNKSQVTPTASHKVESSMNIENDTQIDIGEEIARIQMHDGPSDPPSTAEVSLGNYDHLEDDELFDAQAQMYTNNGVTEDDFSFFDKPNQELLSPESMNFTLSSKLRRHGTEILKEPRTDDKMQGAEDQEESVPSAYISPERFSAEVAKQNSPSHDLIGTPEDYEVMEMEEDLEPSHHAQQSGIRKIEIVETAARGRENFVRRDVLENDRPN